MFDVYYKKKEILIWCFLPVDKKGRNVKRSKSEDTSNKKRKNSSAEDDNDSDGIATLVEALKQKHGNAFSIEQYNAWAQLINLGKHASTEEPP